MKEKKYLFLDIDGVMNDSEFTKAIKYSFRISRTRPQLWIQYSLCRERMQLLNTIVHEFGLDVVISSTWREAHYIHELQRAFNLRGAKFKILDYTPVLRGRAERGEEIQLWMDMNGAKPQHIVILDDKLVYGGLDHRLVLMEIDSPGGLREKHLEVIREMFR